MFILLERPATTQPFGLFARSGGKYNRPIVGNIVDFRVEDFMPHSVLESLLAANMIGRLPDIPEIGQVNKYFSSTFNVVDIVSQQQAMTLLDTGQYLMLPDNPSSEFWEYTNAPWWEYATVIDKYDGFIKAPARPRSGEPTPEEADERIDLFPENKGKIRVVSPFTLDKWATQNVTESYIERLKRI
jgi:hypothetical protein